MKLIFSDLRHDVRNIYFFLFMNFTNIFSLLVCIWNYYYFLMETEIFFFSVAMMMVEQQLVTLGDFFSFFEDLQS